MREQNKAKLIKEKEKKRKTAIYSCPNIYTTYLYCHKFMTRLNVRYIRCYLPTI